MPRRFPRICPLCEKPGVSNLSSHLEIAHNTIGLRRTQLLKEARISWESKKEYISTSVLPRCSSNFPKKTIEPRKRTHPVKENAKIASTGKRVKLSHGVSLETEPYPDFMFRHKFSLLVVGPSQSGKTAFVEQILTKNRIFYEAKKPQRILWYYSQWQERYQAMKSAIGKDIHFYRGLPNFQDDLREIDPKCNNVIIFDDLMAQAIESPIVSRLFTQGRHRNASVILLLQNMFPKGKFNTDISRNAQYVALFRSPSDRKQIGIVAERMFDKNRQRFMTAYYQETERPYGYIFVDNKPDTAGNKQVLSDIFGCCRVYPSINKSLKQEETVETINPVKNTKAVTSSTTTKCPVQPSMPKPFDLVWSEIAWPALQNLLQGAPYCKHLPEGFGIAEMYTSARNPYNPYIPTVMYGYENYWPVKIRHCSNGRTRWIYICEDEPSVKSFLEETRASEKENKVGNS